MSIQDTLHTFRFNGITPELFPPLLCPMKGWFQLDIIRQGQSHWHIGCERNSQYWAFSIHGGLFYFSIIGPFQWRCK